MKKHRKLIAALIGLFVVAGLVVGGVVVLAQERAETAAPAADAAPAVDPAPVDRAVIAKGIVVPAERAALSMAASGIVAELLVEEGQPVAKGDVILRLRDERQRAALAEADAAVLAAQAQLAIVRAGARDEEIATAQAGLEIMRARLARLEEGSRDGDVAAARANLLASQAALSRLNQGADENVRAAAAADLASAEAALRSAQSAYDQIKERSDVAMMPQSLQLEQATNAYKAAQARYSQLVAPPKADQVAQASAAIRAAQAELDRAVDPATEADLAEAQAAVRQAEAQLQLLQAGARQGEIAAAEAAVAQAEAARQQAAAALSDTELRAPFDGLLAVLRVRTGEQVVQGVPLAEIGDARAWLVETDDLSELDVVRVRPGQEVRLTFDAIPGLQLRGVVERVQPKGEKKLGDMTYMAVVRVREGDERLLWNMTAVVELP